MASITDFLKFSTRLIIVYLATLVNIALAVIVTITIIHSKSGTLVAQEDFGVFWLIVRDGGVVALVCLITILIESFLRMRKPDPGRRLRNNPVIILGILNCVAPLLWAVGLILLV